MSEPGSEHEFRCTAHLQLLQARLGEAEDRLAGLEHTVAQVKEASEDSNADDEHDPEGATIAWDRAQASSLAAATRTEIAQLAKAATRIEAGWDGSCSRCGRPIPVARLEARPATEHCVHCA